MDLDVFVHEVVPGSIQAYKKVVLRHLRNRKQKPCVVPLGRRSSVIVCIMYDMERVFWDAVQFTLGIVKGPT